MKKILLILAVVFMGTQAFADEFILLSERAIKAIYVRNSEILKAEPLYTIDNKKDTVILTPKKDGKTLLLVNLYDEEVFLDAKVKKGEISIKSVKGFELQMIDRPPKEVELIPPVVNMGK